ncbi:MAG: sensor histidine kinase [Anaerovoracaceae bacterium]|jgi:signal transduction histidine kinase
MIKRLRKKVFWSIELTAVSLILVILLLFNYTNWRSNELSQWKMMSLCLNGMVQTQGIWDGSGSLDSPGPGKRLQNGSAGEASGDPDGDAPLHRHGNGKYLKYLLSDDLSMVVLDSSGSITSRSGFISDEPRTTAAKHIREILSNGKKSGSLNGEKFAYRKKSGATYMVLFRTGFIDSDTLQDLLFSLAALVLAGIIFALIARLIAKRIVTPVERSMEKQKQFMADASHELKTPVTIINANAAILKEEIGENKWLGFIETESSRMTSLINSILQLSRLDYEDEEMEKMHFLPFDMSTPLLEAALPLESIAFENGIHYEIRVPDSTTATGDPDMLRQIAEILLENAIKNTPRGGTVTLSVKERTIHHGFREQQGFDVMVTNTGEKIPADILPHIFDRFFKADGSRSYESGSFGLGLAIARSLARKMRTDISVTSNEQETTFSLPLASQAVH